MKLELTKKQIENLLLCAQYAEARIWNNGNCGIQASEDYNDKALNNAIDKLSILLNKNYMEIFQH